MMEVKDQLTQIDSIFSIYDVSDQSLVASTEITAFSFHKENKNNLRNNNLAKKLAYAFIYFGDEEAEKSGLNLIFEKLMNLITNS